MKSYIDIFNLEGKVAVITGGATGLGFSMAQCLAGANATVVLVGEGKRNWNMRAGKLGSAPIISAVTLLILRGFPCWWIPLYTGLAGWMSLSTMQAYR